MNTQAYFDNIQNHIADELQNATNSIIIAVAWFTDAFLFSILCGKARKGLDVNLLLMDDSINNGSLIDYQDLVVAGGKVWKISTSEENNKLMHNKFCVVDKRTIINGSYNWTNKAKHNHESITIIQDDTLAHQFIDGFNAIKLRYFGNDNEIITVDFSKICIRLETLKSVILLEDEEDIAFQTSKLKKALPNYDGQLSLVWAIVKEIEQKHFGSAVSQIIDFISKQNTLSIYINPEVTAMQLEAKVLGLQISSLEDEKTEIEKKMYLFNLRHSKELGFLISELLKFRRTKLKKEAEHDQSKQKYAEEAEKDYTDYQKSYEEISKRKVAILSDDEQAEIKQCYRKATKLCHPDVVNESQKEQAEILFQSLKDAYDSNDLQKVKAILSDLEIGIFTSRTATVNEKSALQITIAQLRRHRDELELALIELKESANFAIISDTKNWDSYFESTRIQLEQQLNVIKLESADKF